MTAETEIAPMPTAITERAMANAIRVLAMDAVEQAKSGHPGMPMGFADVATVLVSRFLKFDAADPAWPDRDRLILSAGHGSMLLYALFYLTGVPGVSLEEIKRFRQMGSLTPGHPEYGHTPGVETTTGPLGQGLATSIGMALAERIMAARFGGDLVDHRTYVLASDGDLMEGLSHEAISLAGHLKLSKLTVLFDDNGISIDGDIGLAESGDMLKRFEAAGWSAERVDGHDPEAVAAAIARAQDSDRPSLIACKTVIGFGAPNLQGSEKTHGAPLGAEEAAGVRRTLDWPHAPFTVPSDILEAWRAVGRKGAQARVAWQQRYDGLSTEERAEFERRLEGLLTDGTGRALADVKAKFLDAPKAMATRKASGLVLEALAPEMPELIGGSADLSGSNNTKAPGQAPITAEDFSGSYIHYGVREHAMTAALNGMALHGGVRPYAGTFLIFSDYALPAIRLAALMKQPIIFIATHDSIGVGEDGPTHQPIEQLAGLRAMPNLDVFRPADAVETAECWQLALERRDGPSVLVLSRQNIEPVRMKGCDENRAARGAYVVREADGPAAVTLIATGAEVALACEAQALLTEDGIAAKVVSMPSWPRFAAQTRSHQDDVLGTETLRVGIEAASGFGWEKWLGRDGVFVGMTGFGASAPAKDLFAHFGLTAEAVAEKVKATLTG